VLLRSYALPLASSGPPARRQPAGCWSCASPRCGRSDSHRAVDSGLSEFRL